MAKINKNISSRTKNQIKQKIKSASSQNPYFDGIRQGLTDVVDSLKTDKKLTCREVAFPEPPKEMKPKEIVDLREKQLHLSQHLFALLLNVSPKTVQAWEQNLNSPGGAALRLLWLAKNKPEIFKSIIPK